MENSIQMHDPNTKNSGTVSQIKFKLEEQVDTDNYTSWVV